MGAASNSLNLVLRDEGLMKFVKYLSAQAAGSRRAGGGGGGWACSAGAGGVGAGAGCAVRGRGGWGPGRKGRGSVDCPPWVEQLCAAMGGVGRG